MPVLGLGTPSPTVPAFRELWPAASQGWGGASLVRTRASLQWVHLSDALPVQLRQHARGMLIKFPDLGPEIPI